ncbi:MAG: hypothetical protein ABI740_10135 [Alphaproteobacteria bacterium]
MAILAAAQLVPAAALDAYVMDPTPYAWGPLLAPYSPPLPPSGLVILASYFGDVFVEDEAGVWWVNGLEARVDRAAPSREAFVERLNRDHLTMLKTKLMDALIIADKLLPAGMLYGLKTPRSEGGAYSPDNIGTAPVGVSFTYMGDLYRQKAAPPQKPKAGKAKAGSRFWSRKS